MQQNYLKTLSIALRKIISMLNMLQNIFWNLFNPSS